MRSLLEFSTSGRCRVSPMMWDMFQRRSQVADGWLWVWTQGVLVMPEDWIEVVW